MQHLGIALVAGAVFNPFPLPWLGEASQVWWLACGLALWAFSVSSPWRFSLQVCITGASILLTGFWCGRHPQAHAAATMALACGLAFWIGYSRNGLPRPWIILALVLMLLGGFADLFAFWPNPLPIVVANHGPDAVASFFENRHAFAGMILVGLFASFYWIEKTVIRSDEKSSKVSSAMNEPADANERRAASEPPPTPKQLAYWAFSLCLLIALALTDSHSAQGAFFMLFIPLLFLSVRLDFREPHPERLIWVAGATLCAGLVWINLPDRQLHAAVRVFSENPLEVLQNRNAAKGLFTQSPWLGHGSGSYGWAARSLLPSMTAGVEFSGQADSLWQALEPGFDEAETQIEMAMTSNILAHANSHPLQVLAENGFVGLALEFTALGLALFGLLRHALKTGHAGSRYAAMALAALALHGLFSPALETPFVRAMYFGLIGYGAAQWSGFRIAFPSLVWGMRSIAVIALAGLGYEFHLQVQAKTYFEKAMANVESPKIFTDNLVEALAYAPGHVEANYAYAQVLVRFGRLIEALQRIDLLAERAPDPPRQDFNRASLFLAANQPTQATQVLNPWLHRQHPPLPALELVAGVYRKSQNCEALQRLVADSTRLRAAYPIPSAARFTVSQMQSDFETGEEVNFLQKWFGGKTLRDRFMKKRLEAYHTAIDARARVEKVLQTPCEDHGSNSDKSGPSRHRIRQG